MATLIRASTPEETVDAIANWLRDRARFAESTHDPAHKKGQEIAIRAQVNALLNAADSLGDVVILPTQEVACPPGS